MELSPQFDTALKDQWFTAFDLETTGLSAGQDKIIEIAALRFKPGNPPETYQSLINPQIPIPPQTQAIHHISDQLVEDAPIFAEVAEDIMAFIQGSVLVAHNASFDMTFLACELQRARKNQLKNPALDSCRLARHCLPEAPNYKLSTLAEYLKLETAPSHRAMPDAQACKKVFEASVQNLPQTWDITLKELVELYPQVYTAFQHAEDPENGLPAHILEAIQTKQELDIVYHNGKNKKLSRKITPLFLGGIGEFAYVEAYCHLRQSHRQFRLNRILLANSDK